MKGNPCVILFVLCVVTFQTSLLAQSLDTLKLRLVRHIPLTKEFDELELDSEGNVLLLDTKNNQICKYYADKQYDSLFCIGGKGSRKEGFLSLTHINASNRQLVFVLDAANRKIVTLNTNLKPIQNADFLAQEREGFEMLPVAFDVNSWGDLYVLNEFDNKVYRFTASGFSGISFGGLDYGKGSLLAPAEVIVAENNDVYVFDIQNQVVSVFDVYGVYKNKIILPKGLLLWNKCTLFAQNLLLVNEQNAILFNFLTSNTLFLSFEAERTPKILDVKFRPQQVFVLTRESLEVWQF